MKTAILGYGISGAIAKAFFPEAIIYSPEKTEFDSGFGPKHIWDCKINRGFLKEAGIPYQKSVIKVGYYAKGLGLLQSPSPEQRISYFEKTRGYTPNLKELFMSEKKTHIPVLIASLKKLFTKKFVKTQICKVEPDGMLHFNNRKEKFDRVFSTIPANIFECICIEKIPRFVTTPTFSIHFDGTLKKRLQRFHFIYLFDIDSATRIAKTSTGYSVEYKTKPNFFNYAKIVDELFEKASEPTFSRTTMGHFRVLDGKKITQLNKIHFVGRFAQADYSIKLQDVIWRLKNLKEKIVW